MSNVTYWALLALGLTFACGGASSEDAVAAGGTMATGGAASIGGTTTGSPASTGGSAGKPSTATSGGFIAAGGASGAAGRSCYTEPRDPSLGGAISVYRLYPEVLCYAPSAVAGAMNRVAAVGGAADVTIPSCPAATEPTLPDTLGQASPQSLSSIRPEWVIDGPTASSDSNQCCYAVCMSFSGA